MPGALVTRRGSSEGRLISLVLTALLAFGGGFLVGSTVRPGDGSEPAEAVVQAVQQGQPAADVGPSGAALPSQQDAAPPQTSGPLPASPIQFDPPSLNLGFISPHQEASGVVEVRNPTDKPLRILASRASCTCTSVNLANTVIPPGGSVPLEATLKAGGQLGPKNAAVRVLIEGYEITQVDVRSIVTLAVRAEPGYIMANRLSPDVANPRDASPQDFEDVNYGELTVSSLDGRAFRILASNQRPPVYLDFDPSRDEPRNTYRIVWDLSEYDAVTCRDSGGEPMPAWWIIETDHPDCPIFDLQVRHRCTQTTRLQPGQTWLIPERRALVGQLQPGESVEIEVPLARSPHTTGALEKIVAVSTESSEFSVALAGQTPWSGNESTCRLRITASTEHRGIMRGEVTLIASQGGSGSLTIIGKVAE